jgi:adenylate cyclase
VRRRDAASDGDRDTEMAEDRRIKFRVGINLGDVIADDGDIYGDGVNLAARLEMLAEPGGICISRVVRDQIRDKLLYAFADMGEQSVKNIARPVRAYAMSAAVVASTALASAPAEPGSARRRINLQRGALLHFSALGSRAGGCGRKEIGRYRRKRPPQ